MQYLVIFDIKYNICIQNKGILNRNHDYVRGVVRTVALPFQEKSALLPTLKSPFPFHLRHTGPTAAAHSATEVVAAGGGIKQCHYCGPFMSEAAVGNGNLILPSSPGNPLCPTTPFLPLSLYA